MALALDILTTLVLSVALNSTEAELLDEFTAKIKNNHLGCTKFGRLGLDSIPVFFLTNIGQEAYDLIVLFQKPFEDTAGIKTACHAHQYFRSPINSRGVTAGGYGDHCGCIAKMNDVKTKEKKSIISYLNRRGKPFLCSY